MKGFQEALDKERAWRQHMCGMDTGSYCENAEPRAYAANRIRLLYQQLVDALLDYERRGYELPGEEL